MADLPSNQMNTEEVNEMVYRASNGNVTVEVEAMVESNIGEPLHIGKWTPEGMSYHLPYISSLCAFVRMVLCIVKDLSYVACIICSSFACIKKRWPMRMV